ncbi:karyopherin alpha [Ascoidea rubescens DSM 1968]|uniref:Importin subunit alpha n=1 Tax=Ascoidea rubescens DSM 1968 TaxID=1344418 RepID=A0A1D2V9U7_9ASCO|nr:putative importin subunit alpha [Ascoidea rubescens DSM 1968]ODV58408.1 putative importin subunit alpha [Ascoidea rubescens DSM 1968]
MDADSTNRFVPEHRRTQFKNSGRFGSEELRRRRENQQVELRKLKRDETLAKRRNLPELASNNEFVDSDDDSDNENNNNLTAANNGNDNDDQVFLFELDKELPKMMEQIRSDNFDSQLAATTKFRQILSRENNPPIDLVIDTQVVPILVGFMRDQPEMLQLEAAWALTNIASGTSEQTKVVVENGAVPLFVQLLYSSSLDVKEQAIWALGNVAGDSANYRDFVLSCNAMPPVLALFDISKNTLTRTATWTLSNLCRGKNPQPNWSFVSAALPTLAKLIYSLDVETLIDACWAISYLSDGPSEAIQAVIDARIPTRLVQLLNHESPLVQTPALRAVGNIVTGDDKQTQVVINCGVLDALLPLLSSPKESIRKEACWTISNITAGNTDQIQAVIDANLIPPLIKLLDSSGDYKTRKEACWAISNASSGGLTKPDQIRYLVSQGCIKPLCDLLAIADNKIIEVTLDALENILRMGEMDKEASGESINRFSVFIEDAGGMNKIFECQRNENEKIYRKAYDIIDKYFHDDDAVELNNELSPQVQGDTFAFGTNKPAQGFGF